MNKVNLFLIGLLVLVFTFKIIPVPVENMYGATVDEFIYGGIYWNSILYQIQVKDYMSVGVAFAWFGVLFTGNYLWRKI